MFTSLFNRCSLHCSLAVVACALLPAARAAAGDGAPSRANDPNVAQARDAFLLGADLAKGAQWAEALAAFERSASLHPHALTTYDIGVCERALGHYTRARDRFAAALVETGVAGVREAGRGEPPPAQEFDLLLDPGTHVLTLSRTGYSDILLNRTFGPGARTPLVLELERLPATLHVAANVDATVVTVNGSDVGSAPVDVSRPAGSYRVVVKKEGFVTYEAQVAVRAGEEMNLRATMAEDRALTKKWWFWTGIAAVVVGGAVATYAFTRPAPPPDCGNTGVCVHP
jgi:hypothetical protein